VTGAHLTIDAEALRPVIRAVIAEVLAELGAVNGADRLAYTEAEAATLLGLQRHQLADQRRAGRLSYSRGPKGSILYSRSDLLGYLASRREGARP
jgi:hypothetical protein